MVYKSNTYQNNSNQNGYNGHGKGSSGYGQNSGHAASRRLQAPVSRINPEHERIKNTLSALSGRCTQLIKNEVVAELRMGSEPTNSPILKLVSLRDSINTLKDSPPAQVNPNSLGHFEVKISKFEASGTHAPLHFMKRNI